MKKLFYLSKGGLLCFFLIILSLGLFGQSVINGIVTDETGQVLIGATVLEKGTTNGTTTDIDGSYSISVENGATIVYSFTGFSSQEVAVGSQSRIDIVMQSGELLNNIVVSAQRRAQGILDVPVALTSMPAVVLERKEINDITDIMERTPSVSGGIRANPMGATVLQIRGIGNTGANAGFESAVGVYVDDIYYSRPGLALISFYDAKSVEIYRGPQGTLFGKNISAGAISQKTKAPVIGENSGFVRAEYAEFGSLEVEGAVNLAVGDNSSVRLSGILDNTDGFMVNTQHDGRVAFADVYGFRAQFASQPSDQFSMRLMADLNNYESGRHYQQNHIFGSSENIYENQTSYPSIANIQQMGVSAHLDYDLNETTSLRSITSFRNVDSENLDGDFDFRIDPIAGDLDEETDMSSFSQEFLLTFDTEKAFITTGLHYFNESLDFDRFNVMPSPIFTQVVFPQVITGGAFPAQDPVSFQDTRHEQKENSLGVFAHADYKLSDQVSLIGGLRWTQVNKDISFQNLAGTPEEYYDSVVGSFVNFVLFYLADGGLSTAFPYQDDRSWSQMTYDAALQFKPSDNLQAYVKYSRGFKAGGFNMVESAGQGLPSPDPATNNGVGRGVPVVGSDGVTRSFSPLDVEGASFDSEIADAYEASLRMRFDRGLISLTGFHTDYKNLQVAAFLGLNFTTLNAGSSRSSGLEVDLQYDLSNTLAFSGAATFLNTSFGDGPENVGVPRGRDLQLAPNVGFTLGLNYFNPISDNLKLKGSIDLTYRGEQFANLGACTNADGSSTTFDNCDPSVSAPNLRANLLLDPATLVNMSLGVDISDRYEIGVFGTNIFNTEFYNFNTLFPVGDVPGGNPGAPRILGTRLKVKF